MTKVYLVHKHLVGRFVAEAFSGTMVETVRCELDVFRCDGFEFHLLRKELSDEAVHGPRPRRVFVGAALPGGIGMGKEEICAELLGDRDLVNRGSKRRQHGNNDR